MEIFADGGQSGSSGIDTPGSEPSRAARVTAAAPKRVRTSSSAASSASPAAPVERQDELRDAVVEIRDRDADEGDPVFLDQRSRRVEQRQDRGEDRVGVRRRAFERV